MGYRHYFELIKKEESEIVKNLDKNQLIEWIKGQGRSLCDYEEEENYIDFNYIFSELKKCHEFGKLYWCDTAEKIQATGIKFFNNDELRKEFIDYDVYLVGKEAIKTAIECYHKKIKDAYKSILSKPEDCEDDGRSIEKKCIAEIESKQRWIHQGYFINLDDEFEMTGSWIYEHSIFNLVLLYKTIDFNKYDLIFRGW